MTELNRKNRVLLDCTLRDGGYYNSWDFDKELVEEYLNAMSKIGIDVVEIGFKSLKNNNFKGPYAFSNEAFIKGLKIPSNLKLSVMINASEFPDDDKAIKEKINILFSSDSPSSKIDIVRIACGQNELKKSLIIANQLKDKKFIICLNLMQISELNEKHIKGACKLIKDTNIDVLYFADSIGALGLFEIEKIVSYIRTYWEKDIGIHSHDNLGLALSNTLKGSKIGVKWLDSTVCGMGRGPGNTKTEELLIELNESIPLKYEISPLLNLITNYFEPLKEKYKWGTNPYYFLSAKYRIHPSYIQQMLNDKRYSSNDTLAVINLLTKLKGEKKIYNFDVLDGAKNFYGSYPKGSWNPENIFKEREVLIIGAGSTVLKHKEALEEFINKRNLIVLALNTIKSIKNELINYRIACHPIRLMADIKTYDNFDQPIIMPASMIDKNILNNLSKDKILDFGINIRPNTFEVHNQYCIIPFPLVLAYALGVSFSGSAKTIFLAGIDGYQAGDPRNDEINNLFNNAKEFNKNIISLTPTIHKNLIIKSIYGFTIKK